MTRFRTEKSSVNWRHETFTFSQEQQISAILNEEMNISGHRWVIAHEKFGTKHSGYIYIYFFLPKKSKEYLIFLHLNVVS